MGAGAVHLVVDAVAALVEVAFDLERGELVGHHAHPPTLFVGARSAIAVGEDFVRRVALVALTEGTKTTGSHGVHFGSDRTFGPVGGDNDPASHDRILAQLRHWQTPQ